MTDKELNSKNYKVHIGGETHLVAHNGRPLCKAQAFYRFGRPDLAGFNMTFFSPVSVLILPTPLCKLCAKATQHNHVHHQEDGSYLFDDPELHLRTSQEEAEMIEWDRRIQMCQDLQQLELVKADAKKVLNGHKLKTLNGWRNQRKIILRARCDN